MLLASSNYAKKLKTYVIERISQTYENMEANFLFEDCITKYQDYKALNLLDPKCAGRLARILYAPTHFLPIIFLSTPSTCKRRMLPNQLFNCFFNQEMVMCRTKE